MGECFLLSYLIVGVVLFFVFLNLTSPAFPLLKGIDEILSSILRLGAWLNLARKGRGVGGNFGFGPCFAS